jgi:hypothetical protein
LDIITAGNDFTNELVAHDSSGSQALLSPKERMQVTAAKTGNRHSHDCIARGFNDRIREILDLNHANTFKANTDQVITSGPS